MEGVRIHGIALRLTIALVIGLASCAANTPQVDAQETAARRLPATVVSVYDGDTVTVEMNGRREKVRLLGIDAPEITYGRLRSSLDRLVEQTPELERAELEAAIAIMRRQAESAEDGTRRTAWPQKAMRAARAPTTTVQPAVIGEKGDRHGRDQSLK